VDWPDHLDPRTGIVVYYGDNRSPGRELHKSPRHGNLILRMGTYSPTLMVAPDGGCTCPQSCYSSVQRQRGGM
jgi:hypothetical protein